MAKGYLIGLITVNDAEAYKPYVEAATKAVETHGGRYLVRGGEKTVLEGEVPYERIAVIEFESVEKARAFYEDPGYAEAMKIRHANSDGVIMRVVGYESD